MDLDLKKYTEFHSPGYVIEIYNNGSCEEIITGNREIKPTIKECNTDTLYDIASLTKVYTATFIYIAYEEGKLSIYDLVKNIDNRFSNLDNIRIIDLLSHNQEVWTDGYLGSAKDKDEFYRVLFSAKIKNNFPTYVDTHYIILSTILEKIYNQSFDKILEEKIFDKLNLKRTTINPHGDNIASNNFETLNNEIIDYIKPGLIHDTKGRVGKSLGIITGHASIFTTGAELLEFLKSFLNHTLLSQKTIDLMLDHEDRNNENYMMLKNIVSEDDINKMYQNAIESNPNLKLMKTYNNMGVRYRNSIEALNDIPFYCSNNSITFSGYTGPSFLIDFDKKIIIVVMCNVIHNTKLGRLERKRITDVIIENIYNQIISTEN